MEILAVIVVIALLAAAAFVVVQRPTAGGLQRPRRAPFPRGGRRVRSNHPMAEVVVDHANATGDQEVIAAEQRMQAQARNVAASMQAEASRTEHQRAAEQMADGDGSDHRL